MKKALAFLTSLFLLLSLFFAFTMVGAEEENAYDAAENGDVLYTVDFNGTPGVFEPDAVSGLPDAYITDGGASMQLIAMEDKTGTQWGGEIQTLPLNDKTQYTIYYSITRTAGDGSGLYIDTVYGVYGYNNRTKIHEGTGGLSGRGYVYYEEAGFDLTLPETGMITQEFALEINGVTGTFGHYIKDNSGNFVLIDASYPYERATFNSDKLGLYFYAYYADHVSTFSNCYVVKGLSFATEDGIPENVPEGCINTKMELGEKTRSLNLLGASKGLDKVYYPAADGTETWEGVRMGITDSEDPYLVFDWAAYIYKAGLENVDSQAYPYVAFKLKVEGYVGDFELFYCAGDIYKPEAGFSVNTIYSCESTGEVEYALFDLTDLCEGNYNRFRLDPVMADADTALYLYEIALFATEGEALAYMGLANEETDATTEATTEEPTEAPTTEAPTTEAPTENATTEAEQAKKGCGSILGVGLVTVGLIAASAVCINKKKD